MTDIYLKEITPNTLNSIRNLIDTTNDTTYKIVINSPGGDVSSAFAIYDYIRTSDKQFYASIEGMAHSASVIVLLAVPYENRTANPLATSLIHQVYLELYGDYNPDELEKISADMNEVKGKIASLYADRTILSKDEALAIINEEKERDAKWLLDNGFVSSINLYKNMKPGLFIRIKNLLGLNNKEVLDIEGNVLFTTDEEEVKVGGSATPDGTFEVPEIGTVVIEDGFITSISTGEPEPTEPEPTEPEVDKDAIIEALKAELEELKASHLSEIETIKENSNTNLAAKEEEIKELKAALEDSLSAMKELKATITSNYVPEKRLTNIKTSLYDEVKANKQFIK